MFGSLHVCLDVGRAGGEISFDERIVVSCYRCLIKNGVCEFSFIKHTEARHAVYESLFVVNIPYCEHYTLFTEILLYCSY